MAFKKSHLPEFPACVVFYTLTGELLWPMGGPASVTPTGACTLAGGSEPTA